MPASITLTDAFRQASSRTVLINGDQVYGGGDLLARFQKIKVALTDIPGSCVICVSDDPADVLASICLPSDSGITVLFAPEYLSPEAPVLAEVVGACAVIRAGEVELLNHFKETPSSAGEVLLLTSGTTGKPKIARHEWQRLLERIRPPKTDCERVWLLTYLPTSFAGIQVLLTAIVCGDAIVRAPRMPRDIIAVAAAGGVTNLSSTPTFVRGLIAGGANGSLLPLIKQITLGGEIADQKTLNQARTCFPSARISHIYAATETGALFSVSDGLAGFPRSWLETGVEGIHLRVVDNSLHVSSPRAMIGYAGRANASGWIDTGDLVAVAQDRVLFMGRRDRRINVGGSKTIPEEVERAILEVPGVADVVVIGVPSSLSGQVVLAEVVPAEGSDTELLREQIFSHIRSRLATHQIPRILRFRKDVPLTPSGKKSTSATTRSLP